MSFYHENKLPDRNSCILCITLYLTFYHVYKHKSYKSKGKSDGLSLPETLRPWRKPTNTKNDDGDTILNTTFNQCRFKSTPPTDAYTYIPTQMSIHTTTSWHHQNVGNYSTSGTCGSTGANNTPYSPSRITNFWLTFITAICSSFYRRQVQFNPRGRTRSGHRSDTD